MKFKTLGSTGTKVSEIGMGTYYDPPWIVMSMMGIRRGALKKREAIRSGLTGGMSLIDTAEIYGSEPIVAEAIQGFKRDELFIATKVWPNHLGRDALVRALDKSLRRLRLSCVDLYQVHWPNPKVPIAETMGAMEDMKDQGRIINIGVSNFSMEQLEEANASLKKSQIVSDQMPYSLVNRALETDLLPYCVREKIAILAYFPLGHGKLASGTDTVRLLGQRYSKTPSQIALRWLAAKENVFPIPRASRVEHVNENLQASGWEMSNEDMVQLDERFGSRVDSNPPQAQNAFIGTEGS